MATDTNLMIQRLFASFLLLFCSPLFIIFSILIKITSKGRFLYTQKRLGKNGKPFIIYKMRTMVENASFLKKKFLRKNEASGPVFKIKEDPRYTKVGRFLAHTGLDELPQLVNIIKGEMAFVGPRPLPIDEAKKIPEKYNNRFSVLPGITSLWVIKGAHKLSFQKWMELDICYIKHKNFLLDLQITLTTILLISNSFLTIVKKCFRGM